MKIILSIMLLLNSAFFSWHYNRPQQDIELKTIDLYPASSPVVDRGATGNKHQLQKIVLLSERPATLTAEIEKEQDVLVEVEEKRFCFMIGPFVKRDDIAYLLEKLDVVGEIHTELRETEYEVRTGSLIRLTEVFSRKQARNKHSELVARGVSDISILKLDEGGYTLSLGVFSRQDTTEKRYEYIKSLGYNPKIKGRYKTKRRFWLDASYLGAEEDFKENIQFANLPAEIEPMLCQ